jgi:WD40 repeat protein
MLATASADGIIKIWDVSNLLENGVIKHTVTLADPGIVIHDMAFSPDNRWLAAANADGTINIWNIEPGGGMSMSLLGHDRIEEGEANTSMAISPDGKQLAIADPNSVPAVYELEHGEKIFSLEDDQSDPVSQIGYAPDGATIATCKYGGSFQIWDAANGDELLRLEEFTEDDCAFDYRSDGSGLFLGFFKNGAGWHQELVLPELEPGKLIEMEPLRTYEWLAPHTGSAVSLAYDDSSSSLAVVGSDGELFIWNTTVPVFGEIGGPSANLDPAESEALLARENRGYDEALMDPAGDFFLVTSVDGAVTMFDPETGQALRSFPAHVGRITAAALSADGKQLATGGLDQSIRVWDMETGEMLWSLSGQASAASDLAFSPDGKYLYVALNDGTIRSYLLDVDELIALAQSRVSRDLTDEECRQYLHVQSCPTEAAGQAAQE